MQIKRNCDGPTMPLEQAQLELIQVKEIEEDKHLSIPQLRAKRKRSEVTESIIPIAMADPKGKAVEFPVGKPQK